MRLVAADKDVIVLRTFSKLYGTAGLRCGIAMGRRICSRKRADSASTGIP